MGRRTSRYGCLPFLVLAVGLVGATPGEAVSFALADRDREQAVRMGKKSIVEEQFGAEWRLKDASGQTLVVMTPFHRLALAARNSAFRSQELRPKDIQSTVKDIDYKNLNYVAVGRLPDLRTTYTKKDANLNDAILLLNTDRSEPFSVAPGDRIAQLVLVRVETPAVEEVAALTASARGEGGFGSSGR